ncbi:DUF4411 family protein [Labrys neptuniae]
MHLLDANVLITAKNQYYPIQRVPEFWEWLSYIGTLGAAKIPLEIVEEIIGGNDDVAEWLRAKQNYEALCLDEEVDLALVQAVTDRYAPDLNDAELIQIGRDPFLIAYGLAAPAHRKVVTAEVSKPGCRRANRRVPDVCNDLNVSWCNSFQMMAELNFSTSWKTTFGAE